MPDRDILCPAFEFVMPGRVEHVGGKEVQSYTSSISVNGSPSIAVGFEVFLKRVKGSTARLESTDTRWFGTPGHRASVVMSLNRQQG